MTLRIRKEVSIYEREGDRKREREGDRKIKRGRKGTEAGPG